eukprot:SAG31_NODE_4793_length_2953_cov_14.309741_2_plen_41_part_00
MGILAIVRNDGVVAMQRLCLVVKLSEAIAATVQRGGVRRL